MTLPPIIHRDSYTEYVEKLLLAYLQEVLFAPVEAMLSAADVRQNGIDVIREALATGQIWYADGVFSGRFNAAISRELRKLGAVKKQDTFVIEQEKLPYALRGFIAESKMRGEELHAAIIATLLLMQQNIATAPTGIDYKVFVDVLTKDLQKQFSESVSVLDLSQASTKNPPGLEEEILQQFARETDAEIKKFTAEEAARLSAKIELNLQEGGRTDRLDEIVEAEHGVAQRKARFVAENETSRVVSQYRQQRFESVGSTQYVWQTSEDERVRTDHRALNGRTFNWSSPPVVDTATGRRAHPGGDYNCRCVARAVIPDA